MSDKNLSANSRYLNSNHITDYSQQNLSFIINQNTQKLLPEKELRKYQSLNNPDSFTNSKQQLSLLRSYNLLSTDNDTVQIYDPMTRRMINVPKDEIDALKAEFAKYVQSELKLASSGDPETLKHLLKLGDGKIDQADINEISDAITVHLASLNQELLLVLAKDHPEIKELAAYKAAISLINNYQKDILTLQKSKPPPTNINQNNLINNEWGKVGTVTTNSKNIHKDFSKTLLHNSDGKNSDQNSLNTMSIYNLSQILNKLRNSE